MRREIPMIVAFVAGVIIILEFFVPALTPVSSRIQNWYLVVVAFAILVGAFNLLRLNYMKVRHRRTDWPFAILLIVGFFTMALAGLIGGIDEGTAFDWLFNYFVYPMSSTMFALLAFFVASAAYRAFRARTVDSTLLLAAAFIVMLGQVPIGSIWVPSWWPFFLSPDWLKDRIMDIGNTAGQRAILIGASLGVVSTSLRILLGIERSYLGEE
ncbi:MAG: hypothetical protein JSU81_02040 [Candidatus Coatesbacteria bacterium]|nr:MAG: hypothetical protein JSU81_02040 [Candidatus Coatesbacteria bacterium]